MKKNTMMRIASCLLIAVLMTTCVISGTFAKYTSTQDVADKARVAKWSFEVNDTNIAKTDIDFELFGTVYDTTDNTAIDANKEGDISVNDGTIIAPGTWGYVDITLENTSEVSAMYAINYTLNKTDAAESIPLQFKVVKDEVPAPTLPVDGWAATLTNVDAHETNTKLAHTDGTTTYRIYWQWAYEGDDTAAGIKASDDALNVADVTLTVSITATQID